MADAIMRIPAPAASVQPLSHTSPLGVQRCSCSQSIAGTEQCQDCQTKAMSLQRVSSGSSPQGTAPPIVHEVLGSPGQPLDRATRDFMEPRFGQDFSGVRVHTDSKAAESATVVNALAYTVGHDVVLGNRQYAPQTTAGQRLLAHELTHVIQQASGRGATIQRACKAAVPKTPGCAPDPSIAPPTTRFLFRVNCDDFEVPGSAPFVSEEARMEAFFRAIPPTAKVSIVGLASFDGPADLNERLACTRAQRGLAVVKRSAPSGVTISSVVATVGGPTTAHDARMRAVGVNISTPSPAPPPVIKPGPRTPCERNCEFNFSDCLGRSEDTLQCLAQRSACLGGCGSAKPAFEVCARLLQPPVEVSGCNHSYIETPTRRYAIITPCTSKLSFATPGGGAAIKTDRSPDPCGRRPTCVTCVAKPGVTDLEKCFESQFKAYAAPSVHKLLGPNSNTFAGTLARGCCDKMVPQPAALGCLPGWDDPPAPSASAPCPTGPPVC
jgi:hypothetical protein